ncbi:MAG: phytanoyl-CoA dioxygenase family protein, partial [Methyloligellaceae bacterium]
MTRSKHIKVFFEPKVERHDPGLYAHAGEASGMELDVALAGEAGRRFAEQGFVLIKGVLSNTELEAARAELQALTTSDQPRCEMIWFEGGLRDHFSLSEKDDGDMDGKSAKSGFTLGQSGRQLPPLDPAFRAGYVRKLMGFTSQNPALGGLAAHPGIIKLATALIGAPPRLFQEMALIKPPGGREKPWHQDQAYFNLPLDTPVLGVWMPFGRATPADGCMHLLKGAHRL